MHFFNIFLCFLYFQLAKGTSSGRTIPEKTFWKPGHVGNLGGSVFFVGDHFGTWMNYPMGWDSKSP